MLAHGYSHAALSRFIEEDGAGLAARARRRSTGRIRGVPSHRSSGASSSSTSSTCTRTAQRRGVGSRLIATAEAGRSRPAAARRSILNVNKNNVQAIRAYEKSGFAIRESVVVDIGGGFVMDDYVMAKAL